jgi:hypothetical protein
MSEIKPYSIYDSRIVQESASYAVYKGGEAVTSTVFNSISSNAQQHTFSIQVPSPNVFVERSIPWTSSCYLQLLVTVAAPAAGAGALQASDPVIRFGRDMALAPFPLHSLVSTTQATINDCVVSLNTGDLLPEILRLTDYNANLKQRTCATALDNYQNYNDSYGTIGNVLGNYSEALPSGHVPNGAYYKVWFTDGLGNILVGNGAYGGAGTNAEVFFTNGIPTLSANAAGTIVRGTGADPHTLVNIPIYIKFTSTENLVLNPFVFSEVHSNDIGLFGINNISLVCNIGQPNRVVRSTTAGGRTITNIGYLPNLAFSDSKVNITTITPSLSVPLPAVSMVPFMEFPRYTSAPSTPVPSLSGFNGDSGTTISTNNIVLSCIPDMLLIYAKPQAYAFTEADWHLPIRKVSINFNNFSGLMNSFTSDQLYEISTKNGLSMDYNMWNGQAVSVGGKKPLVGGMLLLKPGIDFALSSGLASGLNGNFNIQMDITLANQTSAAVTPILYVVAINSGWFESVNGTSRIRRAPLTERDIIEAPVAGPVTQNHMRRLVGGGFWSSLGNIFSKVKHFYDYSKPYVSAVKNVLPEGKIKNTMHELGYGKHGKKASDRVH